MANEQAVSDWTASKYLLLPKISLSMFLISYRKQNYGEKKGTQIEAPGKCIKQPTKSLFGFYIQFRNVCKCFVLFTDILHYF